MKKRFIGLLILVGLLFITFTSYLFIHHFQHPTLPVFGKVNEFSLVDSQGQTFQRQQLGRKVSVVDFIFTTCQDTCQMMTQHMYELHQNFKDYENVQQITITGHPEYDTVDVLKKYAESIQADTQKWHFLTGSREDIVDIVLGDFKMDRGEGQVFYSSKMILIDKRGYIRGYYEGTDVDDLQKLYQDILTLNREKVR